MKSFVRAFLLFTILLSSSFIIQAQSWNWVNTIGSDRSDKVITVRSDKESNVIVSGYFTNNIIEFIYVAF